jgi:hypothetical protein
MTHKVLKSITKRMRFTPEDVNRGVTDFASAVKNFSDEMKEWKRREDIIASQPPVPRWPEWSDFAEHDDPKAAFTEAYSNFESAKLNHVHPVPRPHAHPDIESAINSETLEPDYEIINDDPTDDQVLRAKKNALLERVRLAEHVAIDKSLPPIGKRRLNNMREIDIRNEDEKRYEEFRAKATTDADRDHPTITVKVDQMRAPADTDHLASQADCRERIAAIERASAQAMSDIEDLTLGNIDRYEPPAIGASR